MRFDRLTIALLILRPDAPCLTAEEEAVLQDAHMAFLADLHATGQLLAAGPLLGSTDEPYRGLSILNVEPEQARQLHEQDPAIRAGRYTIKVLPWMVPGGAIAFSATRFPRSIAEARGD